MKDESGFTLIELLVVMLILGVLAAIAIPAFFNQKDKAADARAKEVAHSAEVAMEACATDHNGSYASCDIDALQAIEPTLPDSPTLTVSTPSGGGFTVVAQSLPTSQTFTISRSSGGQINFSCTVAGVGGCPPGSVWGS